VSSNTGSGVGLFDGVSGDLGTRADPGGNTFTGNTSTGLQLGLGSQVPVPAVGNTWNANVQGADAAGHYSPTLQKTGPTNGTNYLINNASVVNL
jgi:hypothetical protein